jgi:pilus assembly protein CpaB
MKMKSLILIFIALGCGLVASIGISQVMSQGGKSQKIEMDQILVAKDAIDSGKKLDANMVQFEEWPKQRIPDGALRKMDELEGKFSSYRFFKGEPILEAKISDKRGGVIDDIPPGYRVNNIRVEEDTVIEAITPGDAVDVSVFLEAGRNGVGKTGVYTILKNVRVFAKGGQTERTVDEKGQEVRARTVSLLVKPVQSQELVLAYRLGKISLALRPPNATDDDKDENFTSMTELLDAKGSNANEEAQNETPNSIGNLLSAPGGDGGPKGPAMELHTPKGATRYVFPEDGGAPIEQRISVYGPGPLPAPQPVSAPANPPLPNSGAGVPQNPPGTAPVNPQ